MFLAVALGFCCFPRLADAQISAMSAPRLPQVIPLFPLSNTVVLPYQQLSLRLVEPRYRALLTDAMASNRVIGIVQIQPGFESDALGRPPIFSIGTAAIVVRADDQDRGAFNVVVRAFTRYRITAEIGGLTYRMGQVEALEEYLDDPARAALSEQRRSIESALTRVFGGAPGSLRLPPSSDEDFVNSLVVTLELGTLDRQVLLEQPDALARARKLVELLTPLPDTPRPDR